MYENDPEIQRMIRAGVESGEKIIRELQLNPNEQAFCKERGQQIIQKLSEEYFAELRRLLTTMPPQAENPLRPVCISAALAYALATSYEYVKVAQKYVQFPKSPES